MPQSTETETVSAPPPAPADTALPEGALGKVQVQDAGDAGDEAAAEDALSAESAGEEPAEGQESAQDEVCIQFFQSPPMDGAGAVCRLEEAETVSVTITAWQDEAFTAQVTDPGGCDFLHHAVFFGNDVTGRFFLHGRRSHNGFRYFYRSFRPPDGHTHPG